MHIAVVGAGAIGSLLGGSLSESHRVTLVGHENPHLEAMNEEGLVVRRPDGSTERFDVQATPAHPAVEGADLLILAVKSYDTESAMEDVAPYLGETRVLTVQNGLGNAETIREFVPERKVYAGTTTNGADLEEPGVVRHTGWGDTTIGRMWGPTDDFVQEVADSFREAGFETEVVDRVERAIWEKVLVNVGINPVTALAGVPNGRLVTDAAGERLLETAVEEAATVARTEGHTFETDPVERTKAVAKATAENRSSMRQDVESGSKTEIGALNGAIVDRASARNVPVPVNRTLTDAVRLLESEFED